MKAFVYDTILEAHNICNLQKEKKLLLSGALANKKMVVYGPRNFGKTSLIKSVIIPEFQKKHKKSFILFADLMEVKALKSIEERIKIAFEMAFNKSFPSQSILENAKKFLLNLRPQLEIDALTGAPSLTVVSAQQNKGPSLIEIFKSIKKISTQIPTLIILDEFQDIAFVPEAQGQMRGVLQELPESAIILMGSKQHLLAQLFAHPTSPLAAFGEDVEFKAIAYNEFHTYMQERFKIKRISINLDMATLLQNLMFRVPEPINIICAHLWEYKKTGSTIKEQDIYEAMSDVTYKRQGRYEEYLAHFSSKEEDLLTALAHFGPILQPTGKDFLKEIDITPRAIQKMLKKFLNHSIITIDKKGIKLADPLFLHYLKKFRSA